MVAEAAEAVANFFSIKPNAARLGGVFSWRISLNKSLGHSGKSS